MNCAGLFAAFGRTTGHYDACSAGERSRDRPQRGSSPPPSATTGRRDPLTRGYARRRGYGPRHTRPESPTIRTEPGHPSPAASRFCRALRTRSRRRGWPRRLTDRGRPSPTAGATEDLAGCHEQRQRAGCLISAASRVRLPRVTQASARPAESRSEIASPRTGGDHLERLSGAYAS